MDATACRVGEEWDRASLTTRGKPVMGLISLCSHKSGTAKGRCLPTRPWSPMTKHGNSLPTFAVCTKETRRKSNGKEQREVYDLSDCTVCSDDMAHVRSGPRPRIQSLG